MMNLNLGNTTNTAAAGSADLIGTQTVVDVSMSSSGSMPLRPSNSSKHQERVNDQTERQA
jgi:hypothetical protein